MKNFLKLAIFTVFMYFFTTHLVHDQTEQLEEGMSMQDTSHNELTTEADDSLRASYQAKL